MTPRESAEAPPNWRQEVRSSPKTVVLFTGHLATCLQSGVELMQSLEALSHQEEDPNFGLVVQDLRASLSQGSNFSGALSQFPRIFSPLYVSMVKVGEDTGQLAACLDSVRAWQERDIATFNKVKSSMTYPAIVLSVSFLLTILLFRTVVPQLMMILESSGAPLPVITKFIQALTNLASHPGTYLLGLSLLFLAISYWRKSWNDPVLGPKIYLRLLSLPGLGPVLMNSSVVRFCTALEMGVRTGLDISKTVEMGCLASGNRAMEFRQKDFCQALSQGVSVSEFTREHPKIWGEILPPFSAAGEESGTLGNMLIKVRDIHAQQLDHSLHNFQTIIEPVLLVGVALMIGTVLVSVILPLYSVIGDIG